MILNNDVVARYNPTHDWIDHTTEAIITVIMIFIVHIILDISGIATHHIFCCLGAHFCVKLVSQNWIKFKHATRTVNTTLFFSNKSIHKNIELTFCGSKNLFPKPQKKL
jgi:hypothetical protein